MKGFQEIFIVYLKGRILFYMTSETLRRMGTSFGGGDFWDRLGGQASVMIGGWCSRQPLTNHK